VRELCARIPLTAERLRYAAFAVAHARWSPADGSLSWCRDALASAITSHASEFIFRTLAERASQLGLEPAFGARLRDAANQMAQTWTSWRAVGDRWDIVTTGTNRGARLTPVATEISDLVLRTGQLAYHNPHWTSHYSDNSLLRDPADLAQAPSGIVTVLAAVHAQHCSSGRPRHRHQRAHQPALRRPPRIHDNPARPTPPARPPAGCLG